MTFLVPVMMWGWIPLNIILFRKFTPQKAILISVIGGVLFLPVTTYDLPLIDYNKNASIAISLLFGIILSGKKTDLALRPKLIDIPIFSWCIISPFLSLMTNGYGLSNALFAVVNTTLGWGVYYIFGRIFFSDEDALRYLSRGIIIGGLIYAPLVFFEARMSPQLADNVYGVNAVGWEQIMRYGGFRPIVFMDHGLMVALWMSLSFIVSLWLFGTREITKIKKIPMIVVVILLLISTILCKSSAAIIYLIFGGFIFFYFRKVKSKILFKLMILIIPIYIIFRISEILSAETILGYLSKIFNAERIESITTRFLEEEAFGKRALENSLLGWGGMDRAWPRELIAGTGVISFIDALYLAIFSTRGYLGLLSLYAGMLLGPWKIMKSRTGSLDAIVLSLVLIFFIMDTLLNGMVNPFFILITGALISYSEKLKHDRLTESENF